MKTTQKGILFALTAAMISGFSIFYAKYTVLKIDPLILTTSRNMIVGLIFLILALKNKKIVPITQLSKKQILGLIFVSICGAVPFYLFFTGLSLISPLTANAIHKTLFIWVGVFSLILFKEKLSRWMGLGYILIIGGQIIVSKISISVGSGELLVLIATLFWSFEHLVSKRLFSSVSSELMGLFRMGGGSLILLMITLITGRTNGFFAINTVSLFIPLIVGSFILFAYVFFWYQALSMIRASLVSFILTFSVVVGGLLNNVFNGTPLISTEILLMGLVFISVTTLSITEFRHVHEAHVR